MRIPSGKIDQIIYFVAIDSTDGSRKTGLTSFTVYRSRKGSTPVAYTAPTVTELSAANAPGLYSLLVDEDTTIDAASDSEEYLVEITATGMARYTRTIELYRRDVASGRTLDVSAGGEAGLDWANIGSPTAAQNLSATNFAVDQIVASVSGAVGSVTAGVTLAASAITAIWDALTSALTTAGSIGKLLVDNINAAITSRAATGAAMTLTSGERTAIANEVEAQIIDETDSEKVLVAITDKIASVNPDLGGLTIGAIASQVRTELSVELARIDAAISSRSTYAGADTAGTSTLLARLTAIRAGLLDNLDATVSSRLPTSGYTAPDNAGLTSLIGDVPTSAEMAVLLGAADDAVVAIVNAIKDRTDNLPSDPADQSLLIAATNALAVLLGLVQAKTDLIPGTKDGKTWAEREILGSSILLGQASGMIGPAATYKALDGSKNRFSAPVDAAAGTRGAPTLADAT